jgi:small subunit ribosomal protein S17
MANHVANRVTGAKNIPHTLTGTVVSDKMQKTVVVKVDRMYTHPFFKKVIRTSKKYSVHDEQQQARVGDVVKIYEGRPMSKTKYMYLAEIIKAHATP